MSNAKQVKKTVNTKQSNEIYSSAFVREVAKQLKFGDPQRIAEKVGMPAGSACMLFAGNKGRPITERQAKNILAVKEALRLVEIYKAELQEKIQRLNEEFSQINHLLGQYSKPADNHYGI